jgi:hypothetical protein
VSPFTSFTRKDFTLETARYDREFKKSLVVIVATSDSAKGIQGKCSIMKGDIS